jgi:hypothetical protein
LLFVFAAVTVAVAVAVAECNEVLCVLFEGKRLGRYRVCCCVVGCWYVVLLLLLLLLCGRCIVAVAA